MEYLLWGFYIFFLLIGIIIFYLVVRTAVKDGIILAQKINDKN